eukprot:gene1541-11102_t
MLWRTIVDTAAAMTRERRRHAEEECAAMLKLAEHTAKASATLLDDYAQGEDKTCDLYRDQIANDKDALGKWPADDPTHAIVRCFRSASLRSFRAISSVRAVNSASASLCALIA